MPSNKKTSNLGLSDYDGAEHFRRDDYNADMQIIDEAVQKNVDDLKKPVIIGGATILTGLGIDGTTDEGINFRGSKVLTEKDIIDGRSVFKKMGFKSNGFTYLANPGGMSKDTANTIGAIQILLSPSGMPSDMIKFDVDIYNYSTHTSIKIEIAGYSYSINGWLHCTAVVHQSGVSIKRAPAVRFGQLNGRGCVWIGELTEIWQYPKVIVSNMMVGFAPSGHWLTREMEVSMATSFDVVNYQISSLSHLLPKSHWDTLEAKPMDVAQFTNGVFTFPAGLSAYQITSSFITSNTQITITPIDVKENYWEVESFDGYAVIRSKDEIGGIAVIEPNAVQCSWSAIKGGA